MVRIFLRHIVVDYAVWRKHYDAFDLERRDMGVIADTVFQNSDDDHEITVTYDFDTLAAAQAFVGARELKQIKSADGIERDPTFWMAESA